MRKNNSKKPTVRQPNVGNISTVVDLYEELTDVIFNGRHIWNLRVSSMTGYSIRPTGMCEVFPYGTSKDKIFGRVNYETLKDTIHLNMGVNGVNTHPPPMNLMPGVHHHVVPVQNGGARPGSGGSDDSNTQKYGGSAPYSLSPRDISIIQEQVGALENIVQNQGKVAATIAKEKPNSLSGDQNATGSTTTSSQHNNNSPSDDIEQDSILIHTSILECYPYAFDIYPPKVPSGPNQFIPQSGAWKAIAKIPTRHFDSLLFYIKLRHLLYVHSAFSELDDNFCSLRSLIKGMHALGVQECEIIPCDNVFETRRKKQTYSPRQVIDDIFEQIQHSFGKGFNQFMSYVGSCDPRKSLKLNKTDLHMARAVLNDKLEKTLEEIFLADFCDLNQRTHRFAEVLADIESFGIPVPQITPLDVRYVKEFVNATSAGARLKREKGAQMQSIMICVNLDIQNLGEHEEKVINSQNSTNMPTLLTATSSGGGGEGNLESGPDSSTSTGVQHKTVNQFGLSINNSVSQNINNNTNLNGTTQTTGNNTDLSQSVNIDPLMSTTTPTNNLNNNNQPAVAAAVSRKSLSALASMDGLHVAVQKNPYSKPRLGKAIFEAVYCIVGHKLIFREGVRNRLLQQIATLYDVDDTLQAKLLDITHCNLDARLLNEHQLYKIGVNEKLKLCKHFEVFHQSTLPYLQPSIVGVPSESEQDPRYWPSKPTPSFRPTTPDFEFLHNKQPFQIDKRPVFSVPMVAGPLCYDTDTKLLKTNGYFQRMEGTLP